MSRWILTPMIDRGERLVFIDALRGVAALAVVMFHAMTLSVLANAIITGLPGWVGSAIAGYGERGVQVFFVISGFVIAHSLRQTRMNWPNALQFILRRQLRLDPPYWVMTAVTVAVIAARRMAGTSDANALPDVGVILANALYVQRLVGLPDVVGVSWTLAVEIQFYLAFMLILAVARRPGPGATSITLLLLTGIAAVPGNPNVTYTARWGGHAWPYFVSGVLCCWTVRKQASAWWMAAVLAAMLGSSIVFGVHSPVLVGLVTTLAIFLAGRTGRLHTLWNNRPIQFLGRISYSLYLTHVTVVVLIQQIGFKLTHLNPVAAVAWYAASIAVAVGIAWPFHQWIELPSMQLASRFKRDPGASASTGFGEEIPAMEDQTRSR